MRYTEYVLTEAQFNELKKRAMNNKTRKYSSKNLDAAYEVMVNKKRAVDIAETFNMSRQNLSRILRDLWAISNNLIPPSRAFQRRNLKIIPKTWVRVSAILPPHLAKKVQDIEAEEIAKLDSAEEDSK